MRIIYLEFIRKEMFDGYYWVFVVCFEEVGRVVGRGKIVTGFVFFSNCEIFGFGF